MLNGVAPIILFTLGPKPVGQQGTKIPLVESVFSFSGIPIPLYLDENLTGIYVDSESKAVELDIESDQTIKEAPKVWQRGLDSIVTVNLLAKKDAPLLAAILAFADQIFLKAVATNYRVSYLNGATLVLNGLLKSFTTNVGDNDDLIRMTLVLSKANQEGTLEILKTPQVEPIQGAVPINP